MEKTSLFRADGFYSRLGVFAKGIANPMRTSNKPTPQTKTEHLSPTQSESRTATQIVQAFYTEPSAPHFRHQAHALRRMQSRLRTFDYGVDVVDNDITKIMNDIWGTFLQLSLDTTAPNCRWDGARSTYGSKIDISGEQAWCVTIVCDQDAAKLAASAMFCKAGEELSSDDIQETIAELANMLGGNIKTLLPGRNQLSLPAPMTPEQADAALAHHLMARLAFLCRGSPIEVSLYRQETA